MRFSNKSVIVTASAGAGIGQATARAFAKEGASVVVNTSREKSLKRLDAVVEDINRSGGKAIGIRCDVSKPDEVAAMAEKTLKEFGKIDILVNNAGLNIWDNKCQTWEITDEIWNRIIAVNLTGEFNCCRAVLPHMIKQNWGRIINLSSPAAWAKSEEGVAYPAAKAGVLGLIRAIAIEVAKYGITVNAVAPGAIYNEYIGLDPERREFWQTTMKAPALVGRLGEPPDVANVILFLAAEESSYITGEYICVAGGRHFH